MANHRIVVTDLETGEEKVNTVYAELQQVQVEYSERESDVVVELTFIGYVDYTSCANCGAKTKLVSQEHEKNLCINCK